MNNWEQGADTLNFVYDYGVDGRIAVYQFSKSFGIDFKSHLHIFPKEVYEQCIGKFIVKPSGLACSTRSKQEETAIDTINGSRVFHGAYDTKRLCKMQPLSAFFIENCGCEPQISKAPSILTHANRLFNGRFARFLNRFSPFRDIAMSKHAYRIF